MHRLVAVAVLCLTVLAQTPEEMEKRLSTLPPDRRTYERYRAWISMQPPAVQRSADQMDGYRVYLKTSGFQDADIDQQIRTIQQQGGQLEIQRWNAILTAEKPRFNVQPNGFLVEIARSRTPGAALDVGMGQGRNALWLAQNGWTVTGFDPADKAVGLAQQNAAKTGLKLHAVVSRAEDFDFGKDKWDLIVLSYVSTREFVDKITAALKPGGLIVLEAFHRDAARNRAIGSGVVYDSGELPSLFRTLRVIRYEEPLAIGDFGQERVRLVRLAAEKPVE